MKLSLAAARPIIARVFGGCADDPRIPGVLNEVVQRLLPRGKWVGTYAHYRFCTAASCITLPRQLETVEAAGMCRSPMKIRNEWYQYISDGIGLLQEGDCDLAFQDRGGGFISFEDVRGSNKVLRVYSDTPEEDDAKILLQFWDENANYVRTFVEGRWINGEKVAISTTQTDTTHQCMANGWVGVQKPVTNGTVYIYEYDTVTTSQRLLARYEPDETMPDYRRYLIPGLSSLGGSSSDCETQAVEVIAKLRFIPVAEEEDLLLIGHIGALKLGVMAILKEENNLPGEAAIYWNGGMIKVNGVPVRVEGAIPLLEDELSQFLGDGARVPIQVDSQPEYACQVENLI